MAKESQLLTVNSSSKVLQMYSKVEEHDESPHPKRRHQRRHQGKGPKKSSDGVPPPPPLQPVPADVRLKPVCGGVEEQEQGVSVSGTSLRPKHSSPGG